MLENLLYNYKKSKEVKNILYESKSSNNLFGKKIIIYNPEACEPLQKFWIHIEKAKLVNKSMSMVQIAIFNKDTDFVTFMQSLDSKIDTIIEESYSHVTVEPSIKLDDNFPPVMEIVIDHSSVIFNSDDDMVSIQDIPKESNVSLYIELDTVNISNRTCHKRWRLLQMKKNILIDMKKSFFTKPDPIASAPLAPPQDYQMQAHPLANIFNSAPDNRLRPPIPPPQPKRVESPQKAPVVGRMIPTVADLMNIKSRLKKVEKKNDKEDSDKDKDNNENSDTDTKSIHDSPLKSMGIGEIKLNKVITREPKSMVELMREEHLREKIKFFISIMDVPERKDMKSIMDNINQESHKDKLKKPYKKLIKKAKKKGLIVTNN
jgi:hypothetical protein